MITDLTKRPQELEDQLGDPTEPGRVFSHARSHEQDEREEFPVEICRELDALGVADHYVPTRYGGRLDRYDVGVQTLRVLARRDLTVAIAHGKTFLGAACVWMAGSPTQARWLGDEIRRGAVVSWALTEHDHGSDLLAGEVTARPVPGGFRLDGEKWLINNATRGHLVCVLARTDPAGGPRGFGLLLVDKRWIETDRCTPLPAERLHGIRGADISGIRLSGAVVPENALIGGPGEGLEIVLRTLQLTRVLCGALSLGAADHALALACRHARGQYRFGVPVAALPQTRRMLAEAASDLVLGEAMTLVAARSIHALPGELATVSAATKYLVPTVVQGLLRRLAEVLGARALLTGEQHAGARFQKVLRDHRLVGIFDGSTVVNLHALITQFPFLARGTPGVDDEVLLRAVSAATDLGRPLDPFAPERVALVPRRGSGLLTRFRRVAPDWAAQATTEGEDALAGLIDDLALHVEDVIGRVARYRPVARDHPAEAFALAEEVAGCLAGAAAVQLWADSRSAFTGRPGATLWRSGLWLQAVLVRLRTRRSGRATGGEVLDRMADAMDELAAGGWAVSLLPRPEVGG